MKIQTLSILAGSEACNARCPFCISKMTPPWGVELEEPEVNWRNFHIAARLAKQSGTTTAMITGKGEPTLFPNQVGKYIQALREHDFPLIELQTNGILLQEKKDKYDEHVRKWYEAGLTLVAVSIVHYEPEKNRQVYLPYKKNYIDLPALIGHLHDVGLSVRLACIMADGYIDSAGELERLIEFARTNKVEQLTARPVNKPEESRNGEVEGWIAKNYLKKEQLEDIVSYITKEGKKLMSLPHGAVIFDVHGQNVCLTNSLTIGQEGEEMRQLIFFPDGHLRYDWRYEGAILL